MRKNNSDKSKKRNGATAKVAPKRRSTLSKSRNGATKTLENGSVGSKSSPKNSKWMDDVKKHPEMERQLKQAIQSYHAGKTDEAIQTLEKTVIDYPDRAPILWYLGGFYFDNEQPVRAIPHFQRATELSPKLERASLGLFHALWGTDQCDEALEEMKRFQVLTDWSCRDYLEIMEEIKEKWLDGKPVKTKAGKKTKS